MSTPQARLPVRVPVPAPTRFAAATLALVLALPFALASACGPRSAVGLPCVGDDNCPGDLACVSGACAERGASGLGPDARPGPIDDPTVIGAKPPRGLLDITGGGDDGDEDPIIDGDGDGDGDDDPITIDPDSPWVVVAYDAPVFGKPRVVGPPPGVVPGSAADVVETYFLQGTSTSCAGLARAFDDGTFDPVAAPDDGCFVEVDAVRTFDGNVHVAARNKLNATSSAAIVMEVEPLPAGLVEENALAFFPQSSDDHRGVRPRVTLRPNGVPEWAWSVRHVVGADVIERLLDPSGAPEAALTVAALVDDLDYVFDSEDFPALFFTEEPTTPMNPAVQEVIVRTRGFTDQVEAAVVGAVEAVPCGPATMHVIYRRFDEVKVARVTPTTIDFVVVDTRLDDRRARGDVSIACDELTGDVWAAYTLFDLDIVRVAQVGGVAPPEDVAAASGAVSIAVVDGRPHIAFGSPDGLLRYATRP